MTVHQEKIRLGYYDDPKKLRAFFGEKDQKYLVLHLPDVLGMFQSDRILYLKVLKQVNGWDDHLGLFLNKRIQRSGFRNYTRISIDDLCSKLTIDELIEWQGWCGAYRDVRQSKYEPTETEICDCVKANGKANPKCNKCEGKGKLIVLLEISKIERALAEGKSWEVIDNAE